MSLRAERSNLLCGGLRLLRRCAPRNDIPGLCQGTLRLPCHRPARNKRQCLCTTTAPRPGIDACAGGCNDSGCLLLNCPISHSSNLRTCGTARADAQRQEGLPRVRRPNTFFVYTPGVSRSYILCG
jgi:hypothetical protein